MWVRQKHKIYVQKKIEVLFWKCNGKESLLNICVTNLVGGVGEIKMGS